MRFRVAVSTFVALACLTVCGIIAAVVGSEHQSSEHDAQLTGSQWTVETSGDYGTTWGSPLDSSGNGLFPVRVNLEALARQNFYQPLTLRNTVGTATATQVRVEQGRLLDGDPALAHSLQIRMAYSPQGYCAGPLFDSPTAADPAQSTPHAADAPATLPPLDLEPGTSTTPGQSVTVCFEFGIDRSPQDAPHGEITLAWPLSAEPTQPSRTSTSQSSTTTPPTR